MPKLTQAQLRFFIIKGLHLLAVLAVMAVLAFYFDFDAGKKTVPAESVNAPKPEVTDVSAYELFCQNNQDISCGSISPVLPEGKQGQVILMDTGEIDDILREKISQVVLNNTDTTLPAEDVSKLLDKLYEEDLPDDIIEPAAVSDGKIKNIKIVPVRKPVYFGKNPAVVIVIDDMGISRKRTADIASLKYPLTTAFLTYGKNLEQQVQNSVDAGHEVMLHTPMEPHSKVDVAPDVLTTQMTPDEIQQKLKVMLAKFSGIRGINNHMGSKLTEDYSRMQAVMAVLKEQGLFFLDSKTSAKSKAEKAAADAGIPYAHRHVFLDNTNDKAYILGQLKKTENLARKNGYVIAIGHPKTGTYAALKEWLPKMEERGLQLVHLSRVVDVLHPRFE